MAGLGYSSYGEIERGGSGTDAGRIGKAGPNTGQKYLSFAHNWANQVIFH